MSMSLWREVWWQRDQVSPGRAVWQEGSAAVACDGSGIPAEGGGCRGRHRSSWAGRGDPKASVESVAAFLVGRTLAWFYLAKSWGT